VASPRARPGHGGRASPRGPWGAVQARVFVAARVVMACVGEEAGRIRRADRTREAADPPRADGPAAGADPPPSAGPSDQDRAQVRSMARDPPRRRGVPSVARSLRGGPRTNARLGPATDDRVPCTSRARAEEARVQGAPDGSACPAPRGTCSSGAPACASPQARVVRALAVPAPAC